MVGLGLAFFIEYLDTSVKTMEDVEKLLGVPVLAIIPKNIRLLHKEPGDTPDAEAYRILRTNMEFNRKNSAANCISLVSGGPRRRQIDHYGQSRFHFCPGRLLHFDRRRVTCAGRSSTSCSTSGTRLA